MKADEARKLSKANENSELVNVILKIKKECLAGKRRVSVDELLIETISSLKGLGYFVDHYYKGRRPKHLISW